MAGLLKKGAKNRVDTAATAAQSSSASSDSLCSSRIQIDVVEAQKYVEEFNDAAKKAGANNKTGTIDNLDYVDKSTSLQRVQITYSPPPTSIWAGGHFHFELRFPNDYPNSSYEIRYTGPNRVWHPNIEGEELTTGGGGSSKKQDWGVCLTLTKEWSPARGIKDCIIGLQVLFMQPDIDDALPGQCHTAADQLRNDPTNFKAKAKRYIEGKYY